MTTRGSYCVLTVGYIISYKNIGGRRGGERERRAGGRKMRGTWNPLLFRKQI
jgi:hypothetical protein